MFCYHGICTPAAISLATLPHLCAHNGASAASGCHSRGMYDALPDLFNIQPMAATMTLGAHAGVEGCGIELGAELSITNRPRNACTLPAIQRWKTQPTCTALPESNMVICWAAAEGI